MHIISFYVHIRVKKKALKNYSYLKREQEPPHVSRLIFFISCIHTNYTAIPSMAKTFYNTTPLSQNNKTTINRMWTLARSRSASGRRAAAPRGRSATCAFERTRPSTFSTSTWTRPTTTPSHGEGGRRLWWRWRLFFKFFDVFFF